MSRRKEVVTAAGTLVCALGIGFAMQNTDLAKKRYGSVPKSSPVSESDLPVQADGEQPVLGQVVLSVDEVELTSAIDVTTPAQSDAPVKFATTSILPLPQFDAEPTLPDQSCEIAVEAKSGSAAMVMLSVSAPCLPNERVTILHKGMLFSEKTNVDGVLSMPVPALTENAEFVIAFGNGKGAIASTSVTDLADFDRVALQWRGDAAFSLHARENNADYGTDGHVSAMTPRSVSSALDGTGGFMSVLGRDDLDQPLMVEVYTFPKGVAARDGTVTVSVEAEVTASNCATEIEAQTLNTSGDAMPTSRSVTFAVPGCDAIGDFLVLNNPLEDLKLAAK